MDRIYTFLPSVLILAGVAGAIIIYLKLIGKRLGDNFTSDGWRKNNEWKILFIAMSLQNVSAPALSEIVFRAPLIIAFNEVSLAAWDWIFVSSFFFLLVRLLLGRKLWTEQEINIVAREVLTIASTLPLGILTGYYGIKYQSIWVAFGIHSVWNFFIPSPKGISLLISSWWHKVRMRRVRKLQRKLFGW